MARTLAAALLVTGALAACTGDSSTVSPLVPGSASRLAGGVRPPMAKPNVNAAARASGLTACDTRIAATGSGVFGPSGGTLFFGNSRLIIPAGALKDTVTISATSIGGDSRVEFQPHGLVFAKDAGLLLDTAGCVIDPNAAPNVVYLDELGEILEYIPATWDPRWRTFAAPIGHFSGYAIAF